MYLRWRSLPYAQLTVQVLLFIEISLVTNEFSDRVFDLRDDDTKTVRNLLAYYKVGVEGHTEKFWLPPAVFDKEFVVGVNKVWLVKELQRRRWLLPPRPDGKAIHTRSVYGKRIYLYVFPKRKNSSEQGVSRIQPRSAKGLSQMFTLLTHENVISEFRLKKRFLTW